jgi:hypothetical protein
LRLTAQARVAARKFTWPVVRDEWIKLYHELAARSAEGAEYESQGQVPTCRDVAPGSISNEASSPERA